VRPADDTADEIGWKNADVRPPGATEAQVPPAVDDSRELYLVVITLQPGECMPYDAVGNQKDGAVIWIIQQGVVVYTWKRADDTPADATPVVEVGDNVSTLGRLLDDHQRWLYPGDWVSQDQKVEVTYTNMGSDTAIILKAVWAVPGGGGCGGGCR
jgi:hypothetical protein